MLRLLFDNKFYNLSIISIFIVLISVPFRGSFNEFVQASPGLFPEPSHLGFTVGPLLGILSRNKKYQPIGFLGILFLISKFKLGTTEEIIATLRLSSPLVEEKSNIIF